MTGKEHRRNFLMGVMALIFAVSVWAAPGRANAGFSITRADWKADKIKLEVDGTGDVGAAVQVYNAGTGDLLGSVSVLADGRWKFRLSQPTAVPCRVKAVSNGRTAEKAVRDAPAGCVDGVSEPSPAVSGLSMTKADWKADRNKLDAGGTGAAGAAVKLYNAGTRVMLGSVNVQSDGKWKIGLSLSVDAVPCRVNAVSNSQSVEKAVSNAPAGCVDEAITPPLPSGETVTGSHAGRFAAFEGTKTCLTCHNNQALEVHGSVHYQWKGDASEALGLTPGNAGKLGGINDFCIYPDINWIGKLTNTAGVEVDGGCAKCHAGLGLKPDPNPTQAQLENIDCLLCHSQAYKRKVDLVNGIYKFVPDPAKMTVSILQAASDITPPNKDTCLNCHSKAGGGNNFKRGDIEEAHRNPDRSFDVHMSSTALGGAGLECLDCHVAASHKIAGRGSDLRERDSSARVACTNCHSATPHATQAINKHTARVNCTVCHIPTFAKVAATDMDRDWSRPGVVVSETGLYEPYHIKGTNVVPEYRFFNGKSYFYQFGDPAVPEASGWITLSEPDGKITDAGAKIHAFKYHRGNQPLDPVTKKLLPLKVGKFFETGEIATAVQLGAAGVGWAYNGYQFAGTERYLGLYHEVAPKENALTCNSCHNGGTRLDFDALGYAPLAIYSNGKTLCLGCHGDKSGRWSASEFFTRVHQKHVDDKQYDCSKCHRFSKAS